MEAGHERASAVREVPGKDATQVRGMFASIAPRYDLLNHLLSGWRDQYWRRTTVRKLSPYLPKDAVILDLCTGTGDLALALAGQGRVVGCDFCHPMLVLGWRKLQGFSSASGVRLVEADALHLPFAPGSFDAVTIAFGLRNLANYQAGLVQIYQVLRPGGTLAILEFAQPSLPVFRHIYRFYFNRVLPRLGRYLSGDGEAYSYLPRSVGEFPDPESLRKLIQTVGFQCTGYDLLTGGIVTLHLAQKPGVSPEA